MTTIWKKTNSEWAWLQDVIVDDILQLDPEATVIETAAPGNVARAIVEDPDLIEDVKGEREHGR